MRERINSGMLYYIYFTALFYLANLRPEYIPLVFLFLAIAIYKRRVLVPAWNLRKWIFLFMFLTSFFLKEPGLSGICRVVGVIFSENYTYHLGDS